MIVTWDDGMQALTGLAGENVLGCHVLDALADIHPPSRNHKTWHRQALDQLESFLASGDASTLTDIPGDSLRLSSAGVMRVETHPLSIPQGRHWLGGWVYRIKPASGLRVSSRESNTKQVNFLADIMDRSKQPFAAANQDGKFIVANRSFCRLVGYSKKELKGIGWRDLTPLEYQIMEDRLGQEARKTGKPIYCQKEYIHKSGKHISVDLLVHSYHPTADEETLYYSFITDLSDRRQVEEALQKSEARFRSLYMNAPAMIYTIDRHSCLLNVSEHCLEKLGYLREEVEGESIYEIVDDGSRDFLKHQLKAMMTKGIPLRQAPIHVIKSDGSRMKVLLSAISMNNAEGKSEAILCVMEDVSQQEHMGSVQNAMSRISQAVHSVDNLTELYRSIHEIVGRLMPAKNLYIAHYDAEKDEITFPYYIDEIEPPPDPRKPEKGKGLTEYVISTGEPLLVSDERFSEMAAAGLVDEIGAPSVDWLGVPLRVGGRIIGVLAVQSYDLGVRYRDEDLEILRFVSDQVAIAIDRKRADQALKASEERYALAVRGANDGIWDWDIEGGAIYYSPRWKAMLGFREDLIDDRPDEWFGRVHPEDLPRVQADIQAHLDHLTPHFESEFRIFHRDGSYRWVLTRGISVGGMDGKVHRMAGSMTDITARKATEERLLYDAMHDPLTNLPNRLYFLHQLRRALERSRRRPDFLAAVLFLDIDRFKVINDSLGHASGDQMLIAIANRLANGLRLGDTIARFGGDEFSIILEDIDNISDAVHVANRIQEELAHPFYLEGHEVFTSASIGIALTATSYRRAEDLLRDADTALYRAKSEGRGGYQIFDKDMHTRNMRLLNLETDLRRALERSELAIHYQPIISLATGRMTSVEALLRWQHPKLGMVLPSEFIELAEETGLIVPIGEWVLKEACRQTRQWHADGYGHLRLAANLSARQLQDTYLPGMVKRVLYETGLESKDLNLEITESAAMHDLDLSIQTLNSLREQGIDLSIDDFGTSYSSLLYLKRYPVSNIKIDQTFIWDTESPQGANIITAIISMGHIIGLGVIAEGVETVDQLNFLIRQQCDKAQGFLISPPVVASVITEMLRENKSLLPLALVQQQTQPPPP
ncbi:MAG: EAL domain-containing protein [Anaerolineae bacterium]|nr:EAL domain-containing protein [Anaerolineae bacterium]